MLMSKTLECYPFRHLVIDDWAEPELVRAAAMEWPDENWAHWHRYDNGKLATKDPLRHPPACAELIRRMLCLPIGDLLSVANTFGDWNCYGGGMHSMPPGSQLGVHLDSDHHPVMPWRRAANAVLYVSDWDKSYGGDFELWNETGSKCEKAIDPLFNRLIIFEPTDHSYHAVFRNNSELTRKSLSVFFWKLGSGGKRERALFTSGTTPTNTAPVQPARL